MYIVYKLKYPNGIVFSPSTQNQTYLSNDFITTPKIKGDPRLCFCVHCIFTRLLPAVQLRKFDVVME